MGNSKGMIFGLIGPTASGKTKIAIELAKRFPVEIISCDSMQIYKGMDIGTDKTDRATLDEIRHHMINILEPEEEFSAAQYSDIARKIAVNILDKGKIPFIVGGSGLYFNSFIYGIFPEAGKDKEFRKTMKDMVARQGNLKLHQKLKDIDPNAADKIHPNDTRRTIRALEVYHITGKTITQKKAERKSLIDLGFKLSIYGIRFPRNILYSLIENRVDEIVNAGLIDEARMLKEKDLSLTARMAIGYKEAYSYLDKEGSKDEMIGEIKKYTRHYARRQITWFQKLDLINWIDLDLPDEYRKAIDIISKDIKKICK